MQLAKEEPDSVRDGQAAHGSMLVREREARRHTIRL